MPDEPPIDFAKVQAGDTAEWERAWPILRRTALEVTAGYYQTLGNLDEEDFFVRAALKLQPRLAGYRDFPHLCRSLKATTNNLLRDELDRRRRVKHGGGRVHSLDAPFGDQWSAGSNEEYGAGAAGATSRLAEDESQIRPDEAAQLHELAAMERKALAQIDQRYRGIVWDLHVDGMKQREVAEERKMPIGTVGAYSRLGLDAMLENMPEYDRTLLGPWGSSKQRRRKTKGKQ